MAAAQSRPDTRRHDLDWLRVGAFGLLIFYHIGMFYVPWDWHVKSVHAGPAIEPLMQLVNPWRLSLLFFVSGLAFRFAADRFKPGVLAGKRVVRLFVPLLFGALVIVPPQSYFEVVAKAGYSGSYLEFWFGHYLAADQSFGLILPTWNHLWYIAYLLVYSLVLIPVLPWLTRAADGPPGRMIAQAARGPGILLAPAIPIILARFALGDGFPSTHALVDDWWNHARYFWVFVLGFVIARNAAVWTRLEAVRWPALGLALGISALMASVALWLPEEPDGGVIGVLRTLYYLNVWVWIAMLAGFASRTLRGAGGPVLTYAAEAVYPWYILHQTLIIVLGVWLTGFGLSAGLEAALLIAGTLVGCGLLHELAIRRIGALRFLFGLAPRRTAPRPLEQARASP